MERNIYFKCSCGKHIAVDELGAGRTIGCPACAQPLQIPKAAMKLSCSCGSPIILSANMAGETVHCLVCKAVYKVPELEPVAVTPEQQEPLPAVDPNEPAPATPPQKKIIVRIRRPKK